MELSAKGLGAAVETAARRSLRRRMPAPLFKAPDDIPPSLSLVNYPQLSYDVQVSGGSPDFSQGLDWKLGVEPGLISALISALFFRIQREVVPSTRLAAIPPAYGVRTLPAQATEYTFAYIQVPEDVSGAAAATQQPADLHKSFRPGLFRPSNGESNAPPSRT